MRPVLVLIAAGFVWWQSGEVRFEYSQIAATTQVDNRLVIEGLRATWLHEPAVPLIEGDVIGVFRVMISASEQQELARLMPARSTPGMRPDMPGVSVLLRLNGRESTVALRSDDPSGGPLIAEVQKIVEHVRAHPYLALQIDIAKSDPRRVRIENRGTQPL